MNKLSPRALAQTLFLPKRNIMSFLLVLFCLWAFWVSISARAELIFPHFKGSAKLYSLLTYMGVFAGTGLSILYSKATYLRTLLISITILCFSYVTYFQPTAFTALEKLDFLLAPHVGAYWTFDVAVNYIEIFIYYVGGFCFLTSKEKFATEIRGALLLGLGLGFLLNACVAIYQGLIDIQFLAAGSGTSVSALRAPGLLQDSGASNVYFSVWVAFLFGALLWCKKNKVRLALFVLLNLALVAGLFSGGRLFFANVFLTSFLLLIIFLCSNYKLHGFRKMAKTAVGVVGLSLFLTVILSSFANSSHSRIKLFITRAFQQPLELLEILKTFDSVRFGHWEVMYAAWKQNKLFGTGLGSFHANNQIYSSHITTGAWLADWPSSLYFALASELGMVGILIVSILLITTFIGVKSSVISHESRKSLFTGAFLGGLLSFIISFLVGIHVLYPSICFLFAVFFWLFWREVPKAFKSLSFYISFILLVAGFVSKVSLRPTIPEFRGRETGRFQKPNMPLDKVSDKSGVWYPASSQVLLKSEGIHIFLEGRNCHGKKEATLKKDDGVTVTLKELQLDSGWNFIPPSEGVCIPQTLDSYCYIEFFATDDCREKIFVAD